MFGFIKRKVQSLIGRPVGVPAAIASHVGSEKDVYETIGEMLCDYQLKLADLVLRANAKQASVTVNVEAGDERAQSLADQLTDLYWQKLAAMMGCVAYGRVAFEKAWYYERETRTDCPELNELPYKHTEMRLDVDGNFDGINLEIKGEDEPIILDPEYAWWLALDPTPTEPHGKSRYLGAPESVWRDKVKVRELLNEFVRKTVIGNRVIRSPDKFDDPDNSEGKLDAIEVLGGAIRSLDRAGTLWLSNQRQAGKDGAPGPYEIEVEQFETAVRSGQPILDIVNAMDGWTLLSIGIPPKTIMEGDAVGSFALVSQQMLILLSVVEDIVGQIVESFQAYVVDKAVQLNDPSGKWKLATTFTPLTERPDDLANELVKTWMTTPQLSPLITSGAVDVLAVLEAVGVAVSPDASAKLGSLFERLKIQPDPLRAREVEPPLQMGLSSFLNRIWR